jgi:HKD family nuclease
MKKTILTFLLIITLFSSTFSLSPSIFAIDHDKYFSTTHKILQSAKSSITMVMYYVSLQNTTGDSQVLQLVNDLIDAHNRGIKVKVILDRTMNFRDDDEDVESIGSADTKNKIAYEYFKNNGIEVYYDDKQVYTHAKCIVIDDKIVIMGSTNWSTSALTTNNEISVVIESEEYAKEVLNEIDNIKVYQDTTNISDEDYLKFNLDMMKTFLSFIRRNNDELTYKMYFYILLYTTKTGEIRKPGNEQVEIDYKKCGEYLGLTKFAESKQRYYIRRFLTRLEKNYDYLITYLNPTDLVNNPKIILQDKPFVSVIPAKAGIQIANDEAKYLYIPKKFFEYEWHKRLSLQEQYCYFINLVEGSREYNSWSKSIDTLTKEYGLKDVLISQSMGKLRYWNLLSIKYSLVQGEKYGDRFPNVYRLKELYDMKEFDQKLQDMINKYGKETIDRVLEYANIIYCDHDLGEIEKIISLEDTYGKEKVKNAFDTVSTFKSKSSSKKSMRYIVGMLKK